MSKIKIAQILTAATLLTVATSAAAQSRHDRMVECLQQCEEEARYCLRDAKRSAQSLDRSIKTNEQIRLQQERGLNEMRIKRGLAPQPFNPPVLFATPSASDHLAEATQACRDDHKDCAATCR